MATVAPTPHTTMTDPHSIHAGSQHPSQNPFIQLRDMVRDDTQLLLSELRLLLKPDATDARQSNLSKSSSSLTDEKRGRSDPPTLTPTTMNKEKTTKGRALRRRSSSLKRMSSVFGDWNVTHVRRGDSTAVPVPALTSSDLDANAQPLHTQADPVEAGLTCDLGAVQNYSSGPAGLQTVPEMDPPPSRAELDELYAMTVLDPHRIKVPFGTLIKNSGTQRVVVIFIRHFFCGNCFGYVRALTNEMPLEKISTFDPSTKLIVIACGDPILVPNYIKMTGCPFDIYADPTRQLYGKIGFSVNTLKIDPDNVPRYVQKYSPQTLVKNILVSLGLAVRSKSTNAGMISQNGGELIWNRGELEYTHRMKHPGDHIEIEELERLLKAR